MALGASWEDFYIQAILKLPPSNVLNYMVCYKTLPRLKVNFAQITSWHRERAAKMTTTTTTKLQKNNFPKSQGLFSNYSLPIDWITGSTTSSSIVSRLKLFLILFNLSLQLPLGIVRERQRRRRQSCYCRKPIFQCHIRFRKFRLIPSTSSLSLTLSYY